MLFDGVVSDGTAFRPAGCVLGWATRQPLAVAAGHDALAVLGLQPAPAWPRACAQAQCSSPASTAAPHKQKTAYEIYKGDWSSDVCSSDLIPSFFPSSRAIVAVHDVPQPVDGDRKSVV